MFKKLDLEQKCCFYGGARVSKANAKTRFWKNFSKQTINPTMKRLGYISHNAGLLAMIACYAISSVHEMISIFSSDDSKNKNYYNNHQFSDEYPSYGSYNYDKSNKGKYNKYSSRPSIRFGSYPIRDSIAFGLPWFY